MRMRKMKSPSTCAEGPSVRDSDSFPCSPHAPHFSPALERRPDAALEPEAVDRRRRMNRADAAQPDAGPLESAFLRRAQNEPGGLEDGNTGFSESLRGDVLQTSHGRLPWLKRRGGAGIPSPPLGAHFGPAGLTGMPADLDMSNRFIRPLPPSSEERKRRCGL